MAGSAGMHSGQGHVRGIHSVWCALRAGCPGCAGYIRAQRKHWGTVRMHGCTVFLFQHASSTRMRRSPSWPPPPLTWLGLQAVGPLPFVAVKQEESESAAADDKPKEAATRVVVMADGTYATQSVEQATQEMQQKVGSMQPPCSPHAACLVTSPVSWGFVVPTCVCVSSACHAVPTPWPHGPACRRSWTCLCAPCCWVGTSTSAL